MNFFSHGYRFLDRPIFMAGTMTPDWLSIADRPVRLRSQRVRPFLETDDAQHAEFAAGVIQHIEDDKRFHQCEAFLVVSSKLSALFRTLTDDRYDHRPAFLGHIVTELLMDAELIRRDGERLDRFYRIVSELNHKRLQRFVNDMAKRPTERLVPEIQRFCRVRFLADYMDDTLLRGRLNQVLSRVKLPSIDESADAILREARELVSERTDDLLRPVEGV